MTQTRKKSVRAAAKIMQLVAAACAMSDDRRLFFEVEATDIIEREFAARDSGVSDHQRLITLWCEAYSKFFGFKYAFTPRDAKAAKALLALELTPEDVMAVAERAWRFRDDAKRHFNCKFSVSLGSFSTKINEIRSEIQSVSMSSLNVATAGKEKF